jgi:hypothetical protein
VFEELHVIEGPGWNRETRGGGSTSGPTLWLCRTLHVPKPPRELGELQVRLSQVEVKYILHDIEKSYCDCRLFAKRWFRGIFQTQTVRRNSATRQTTSTKRRPWIGRSDQIR